MGNLSFGALQLPAERESLGELSAPLALPRSQTDIFSLPTSHSGSPIPYQPTLDARLFTRRISILVALVRLGLVKRRTSKTLFAGDRSGFALETCDLFGLTGGLVRSALVISGCSAEVHCWPWQIRR